MSRILALPQGTLIILMSSIVPTHTKISVSTKRMTVFPGAPFVTRRSAAEQMAAKNTVTSSGTHDGMAGTLSVASWTARKIPPRIRPAEASKYRMFQSFLRQPRWRNSSTPAQMSARNAGSSPKAAKNCPKLLSLPGYRKLEIWKS